MPPKDLHEEFFRSKLVDAIGVQMESRGIPEKELGKVKKLMETRFGVSIAKAHQGQLNRMSRELGPVMVEYLDGAKRRPLPGAREPAGFKEFVEAQSG